MTQGRKQGPTALLSLRLGKEVPQSKRANDPTQPATKRRSRTTDPSESQLAMAAAQALGDARGIHDVKETESRIRRKNTQCGRLNLRNL